MSLWDRLSAATLRLLLRATRRENRRLRALNDELLKKCERMQSALRVQRILSNAAITAGRRRLDEAGSGGAS